MPDTLIKVDLNQSAYDNEQVHNRWHPDVPMACWVKPGDDFVLETYDWTGGFIKNDDSADDVRDIDLSIVHFLSGPVGVRGAEAGDLLVVDLLDIGTKADSQWGFNGFFSKQNGGGFLTEHFPLAQKSIWDIKGLYTSSRHVPRLHFRVRVDHRRPHRLPARSENAAALERARGRADRDQSDPRARTCHPAVRSDHPCRPRQGRCQGENWRRRRPHGSAARTRRQLRHQGPVARLEDLVSGLRTRRRAFAGRA